MTESNGVPIAFGITSVASFIAMAALVAAQSPAVTKENRQDSGYEIPRTADNQPDFQGIWDFSNLTPMERLPEFEGKTFLTDEDVAELEARMKHEASARVEGSVGAYDLIVWRDDAYYQIDGTGTSLIVDPPDGRIPALTPDGQKRAPSHANRLWTFAGTAFEHIEIDREPHQRIADGPEDRTLGERCLLGRPAGPPLRPETYNNTVQIFQNKTYVAFLNEMFHSARIIPLDDRPLDSNRQWAGQSRARWEGDTLVIETTHFRGDAAAFVTRGGGENLHLIERIRRVDDETLSYEFTIDDPATWVRPWTAQFPLRAATAMYETSCHEGNYGMFGILSAARAAGREAARQK